jgi:hypothetical protein
VLLQISRDVTVFASFTASLPEISNRPSTRLVHYRFSNAKLKAYLRSVAARSREALEEAISLGLDLITKRDIKGWFFHCCYCTS